MLAVRMDQGLRGTQAAAECAEHRSHLRIFHRCFASKVQCVVDRFRKDLGQFQSIHWDITVGATDIRIIRPIMCMTRDELVAEQPTEYPFQDFQC